MCCYQRNTPLGNLKNRIHESLTTPDSTVQNPHSGTETFILWLPHSLGFDFQKVGTGILAHAGSIQWGRSLCTAVVQAWEYKVSFISFSFPVAMAWAEWLQNCPSLLWNMMWRNRFDGHYSVLAKKKKKKDLPYESSSPFLPHKLNLNHLRFSIHISCLTG